LFVTASREELADLRLSLEGALGIRSADVALSVDDDWRKRWPSLIDLGVSAYCIPEEFGGLGMEASAALVASRVFGAALHGSPYPATVAAAFALAKWLDRRERKKICEEIVCGECMPTVAFLDPSSRMTAEADTMRVDGRAHLVLGAKDCDSFLVLMAGSSTMAFVRAREGCSVTNPQAFDVTRSAADVVFNGASAIPVAGGRSGRGRTERLYGLLLAADALGGTERMLERTRAYALERHAFGKPIGGFQAVQHRLVDHTLQLRGMGLLASEAADLMTRGQDGAVRQALLAEAAVSSGALHILHDLVQLTGAIGFTWEHGLHLYERRAHLDARLGCNPRAALQSLAGVEGWSNQGPAHDTRRGVSS
jgi:alkylation response protein AidB-like acyl-CoA dehydrogenase